MFAKLTALVGGGYSFPYNVEEAYASAWGQWTHHRGTSKEDGSPVSIFKLSSADPNDRRLSIARNGVKRLKLLRHPNILAFKDSAEVTEKGATVIYLVTQPVKPLKLVLEEMKLEGQHRNEYLSMGILHVTQAVSFLNNDAKMIHGNICMEAVVVTETLDWKLHGFDLLTEHSIPAENNLIHASWIVGSQYKPAELGKSEWEVVRESPPWAIDAWGLGCFIQEVFSGNYMTSVEQLRRTDVIPPALLPDYQKLLSSAPSRRLNPAKVAECKFLNNKLVEVVAFMENISVKDSTDKDSFFKRLPAALPAIPNAVAVRRLLPLLSSALEYGGAPAHAVAPLLAIGNTLSTEEFGKRVVPTLGKLFASTDRNLRRSLLESLDTYSQHLTTDIVENQIYTHLQTGFSDANPYIRELTLKGVLSLAPRMSHKTLVNSVLRHLSKLQVDEEPSIRANTTVLLGNVARFLGEATCKRVLVNAFTRALKDVFPPAKIAGLRALVATAQYYDVDDMALRILPTVAPLTIDPVGEVRTSALHVLEAFTAVLKEADAKRTAEQAALAAAGGGPGATSSTSFGSVPAPAGSSSGSVLSWAVSSLISSTGLAATPTTTTTTTTTKAPTGFGPSTTAPAAGVGMGSGAGGSTAAQGGRSLGGAGAASGGGSRDGWAEDEELVEDDSEAQARSRLSARPASAATRSKPAASSGHVAPPAPSKGGWDADLDLDLGEDKDGWEDMDAPAAAVAKPAAAAARPRSTTTSASASAKAGASTVSGTSAGGAAAGARKPGGAMKLGASKLGAQKLGVTKTTGSGGGGFDFDDVDKW